ncbi:hypothetical protein [Leucobacter chironomi]|uniref:hypothetical protein n=1 Tax=Leucobacter chironomi TaxID=491918 RepID=UPI0003FE75AA|nr:hypothetical protein [Leucobacter chironomi]
MIVSSGPEAVEPLLWVDSSQKLKSQNRVHELLSGRVAVTLAPPALRSGSLGLLFDSEAAAAACVELHATGSVFSLEEPDRPSLEMTYVLAEGGGIESEYLKDHTDADLWMVRIDYQEVSE